MIPRTLDESQLEALRRYPTPTIANAIELFQIRPRHTGYLPHDVRCLIPGLGRMIGYAVTSQTRALPPQPGEAESSTDRIGDYFRYVASVAGPKVAVGQDLDDPQGVGAQFGEVTATIHRRLGCVGHVTDGCPRDLEEVGALGFHLYGRNPCVSHGYVRLVDFGKPVCIAGVEILPGDLLHGDLHGICLIPNAIAARVAEACAEVERLEMPLLECCRSIDFDLETYIGLRAQVKAKIRE